MDINKMSGWLSKFADKLKKQAIDKLPEEETQSPLDAASQDPSMDPNAMMPPPIDPSMMEPPKPKVWDNKYLITTDNTKFIVELTPSIVMDPASGMPPDMQSGQADPMADQTLNPQADPDMLQQWMKESDDNDKPYSNQEQGTVDPLSQQDEGIEDTGNEQSVKVHNKKSAFLKKADDNQAGQNESPTPITPGADRSNAYPPCKYCANFNAAENTCSQGLDVEKVQAAKSCSWLNSVMTPFNGQKDPDSAHKDKDSVISDISDMPGNGQNNQTGQGGMSTSASLKFNRKDKPLKDYLDKMWD